MPLKTFTSGEVLTATDVNTYLSNVVVQANSVTITGIISNATTSFVDVTGLSLSITPKSATSKILIMVTGVAATSAAIVCRLNLVRDSTNIAQATGGSSFQTSHIYSASGAVGEAFAISYLDSPATTSATTYKLQFAPSGAGTAYIGRNVSTNYGAVTTLTVMEISQ